jgi:hypothetical protein
MTSSLSFFSFISGMLSEANEGLHQALEASKDQPVQFIIPKMEMQIKCIVLSDNGLKLIPSDAQELNYYGGKGESELKLTFKLSQNKLTQ